MPPTHLLFTLSAIIISCKGECPAMNEIPVMYYDGQNFTCAKFWDSKGGDYAVDSCNWDYGYRTIPDGEEWIGQQVDGMQYSYSMGSIFVKPGCSLYMYRNYGYSGESHVISGPAEIYKNTYYPNGNSVPGPRSYKCRCIQKKIDCEPEDSYEVVLWCDGRDAVVETKCKYEKTIGTAFSDEISKGMSIDVTIEAELSFQFWEIFEARMGLSVSTGFDWRHVSTQTKSEQKTITVEGTVPPGYVLIIEQAVGRCGGSEARTDMFKISHQDKDGQISGGEHGHPTCFFISVLCFFYRWVSRP